MKMLRSTGLVVIWCYFQLCVAYVGQKPRALQFGIISAYNQHIEQFDRKSVVNSQINEPESAGNNKFISKIPRNGDNCQDMENVTRRRDLMQQTDQRIDEDGFIDDGENMARKHELDMEVGSVLDRVNEEIALFKPAAFRPDRNTLSVDFTRSNKPYVDHTLQVSTLMLSVVFYL